MTGIAECSALIAITARADPAYPETLFISLRRYDLVRDEPPEESVEVAAINEALEILEHWLRSLIPGDLRANEEHDGSDQEGMAPP